MSARRGTDDGVSATLTGIEHRFRQIVEHVTDVLFEQDADGRWKFLNPAWTKVTGFRVEDSLDRLHVEFIHPDDAPGSVDRFNALLVSGTHAGPTPVRYVTSDGEFRWLEARVSRITDAGGRPIGTAGTLRDVTAQREMATEIERAHRQAVQSFTRISEFLANVSHEIRTPLNGVLGLATLLLETPLDAQQRQYSSGIHHSAETLLALVNDILDISKIEAGGLTLEHVAFDLREWLDEVVTPAFAKARTKGLETRIEISPALPARVVADPTRTRQVLANLLDNAVKFTVAGSVGIRVEAGAGPEGRRSIRFSVSDSGIGIPLAQHETIFEKYRQADSSTTRRYGGTGLGLAICRQLVILMEGQVGLESKEGRGSTFWFAIPLLAAEADDADTTQPRAVPRVEVKRAPFALVVEDNATNQLVARRFLERAGCRVAVAQNGAEAVARATTEAFDVIFMDCQMPVMDGYEATRQIRAHPPSSQVPIVAMTAHAMTGDREKCLAAGMSDYVSKPLTPDAIVGALERALPSRLTGSHAS